MSSDVRPSDGSDDRLLASILSNPRQRLLVSILREQNHPMTERDLAVALAARERDESVAEVPETAHERVRVTLLHHHLPKLADAGVVERRPDGVVATERGTLEATSPGDADGPRAEPQVSHPRRRRLVSILSDRQLPATLDELVAELASREDAEEDSLAIRLHHVDLPRLADRGAIEYDADERTVLDVASHAQTD